MESQTESCVQAALLRSAFSRCTRFDKIDFAFSNSARLSAVMPRPARLIKYVNMRMPEPGPLGDTLFDASIFAIVLALFVNRPSGGCVESVLTRATHLFCFRLCISYQAPPGICDRCGLFSRNRALRPTVARKFVSNSDESFLIGTTQVGSSVGSSHLDGIPMPSDGHRFRRNEFSTIRQTQAQFPGVKSCSLKICY